PPPPDLGILYSTIVFHSLQEGHLPSHLGDSNPQSEHKNTFLALAMSPDFSQNKSFLSHQFFSHHFLSRCRIYQPFLTQIPAICKQSNGSNTKFTWCFFGV